TVHWTEHTNPPRIGYVDYANDRIYVGPTALVTEDTVTYSNRRGNSIGGLVNDTEYVVINVRDDPATPDIDESNYIQLASTEQKAIDGIPVHLTFDPTPHATVNTKTFGAGDVNGDKDTINLANPAASGSGVNYSVFGLTFELGQPVVYHQGTAPIPGLVDGNTYYVITGINEFDLQGDNRFIKTQVIQLAETENE